ncbi:MAG: twin-arginine translocase subunit TatB [Dehalococcoidales bacterium]|nr:MAG: twin-arginine translocase subunit TatB [Dehalococcoidales bacterium]
MNFLDMGIMEIVLILVVALIIWGPGKIPEIARNLGKYMNAMKKMSFDLTTQVKKELELEEKESGSSSDTKTKSEKKTDTVADKKEKPTKNP